MAEAVRVQQALQSRGRRREVEAGDRRWAALARRRAPGDRGGGRRPRAQPHAGARTPELRPHRLTRRGRGATAAKRSIHAPRLQARRTNLRRARAGLQQQIERLTEAYLAGVVPLSEYQRRRREVETRLLALDGQERELTHDAGRQAEAARLAAHAEGFCQRVRQGLDQGDFHRKRELLELLIDCVVVTGDAVEIRYAIPTGPEGEREPFCRLRTDYQVRLSGPRPGRVRKGRGQARAVAERAEGVLREAGGLHGRHGGVRRGAPLGPRADRPRA